MCLNVSTTPLRQWGFRQCLPFSWTTLRDKHCRHPIVVMGVVDMLGNWQTPDPKHNWVFKVDFSLFEDISACGSDTSVVLGWFFVIDTLPFKMFGMGQKVLSRLT